MAIEYKLSKPTIAEYEYLYETTGWASSNSIPTETFQKSIDNSWYWVCSYDNEKIIGIGRLISDGALYAFICDLIVHPSYQGKGIGSTILKMLKDRCRANGFKRVWLFSAPGKTDFYIKNGFEIRPENAPGMQMINVD